MSEDIMTPVGRMVQGHPMILHAVTDDKTGQPKLNKRNEPQMQCFVGLAIPKGGEQHWNQTPWGQMIYQAGCAAWPRGEHGAPTFAWKITDGDSAVPNKRGIAPNSREGFPGHWIIGASDGFAPSCFADRNYAVQVMNKDRFKTGDYVRLILDVKGNESTQSPGIYINMKGCELIQAGPEIISESALDGQATFGQVAAQLPPGALTDPNIGGAATAQQPPANAANSAPQTTVAPAASSVANPDPVGNAAPPPPPAAAAAPPPPAPAHDFLLVQGQKYTADQLRGAGYSEEQITALPKA